MIISRDQWRVASKFSSKSELLENGSSFSLGCLVHLLNPCQSILTLTKGSNQLHPERPVSFTDKVNNEIFFALASGIEVVRPLFINVTVL